GAGETPRPRPRRRRAVPPPPGWRRAPPPSRRASYRTDRPPAGAPRRPRPRPARRPAAAPGSQGGGAVGSSLRLRLDGPVEDVGDIRADDHETRFAALHRHFVVLQVHDLAKDPPGRQHFVALLEGGQQLAMALLLLFLRPENQEVDDGEHRHELKEIVRAHV